MIAVFHKYCHLMHPSRTSGCACPGGPMKKAIIYGILLLSFLFIGANAAIIEGRGVLQMNTAINFS